MTDLNEVMTLILITLTLTVHSSNVPLSKEEVFYREFVQKLQIELLRFQSEFEVSGTTVADRCDTFMNADEQLGPQGQIVLNELNIENRYLHLLASAPFPEECPIYPKLTPENKALLWTSVLTVIAHFESSCRNSGARNSNAPNGTANGLFQLHRGKEHLYDGDQNICQRFDSDYMDRSIRCTLAMLNLQIRNYGQLFHANSYWEVLRPQGRSRRATAIRATVRNSTLCQSHNL